MPSTIAPPLRELDSRQVSSSRITLAWHSEIDAPFIVVTDPNGIAHQAQIEPSQAAEAFAHPYVFTAQGR